MAILKGAFLNLGAGLVGVLPNIVVFQFNPETVTRSPSLAQPPRARNGSGRIVGIQQPDEPTESISFSLKLDATDQLARSNPIAAASGILPMLSALELLMIPKSSFSVAQAELNRLASLTKNRSFTFAPLKLPTVLFFWGPFRILPVTVANLHITEQQFDTKLIPVRAEVSVSLHVLLPTELLEVGSLARGAYKYTQKVKEVMAALNLTNAAEFGVSPSLAVRL
jgi:hypothetical protein